jgi:hypothetical protein
MYMVEKHAVRAFTKDITRAQIEYGRNQTLIALADYGWTEEFPMEEYWCFTHPCFKGGEIRWVLSTREVKWYKYPTGSHYASF